MEIELDSHPGVVMIDPTIEIVGTYDDPINETFTPRIIFHAGKNVNIGHDLPPQLYVNGTWTDADVENALTNYIRSITA